jgi:hypothetical protein
MPPVEARTASELPDAPPRYLWWPWLRDSEINLITGYKGSSKGTMLVDWGARQSIGKGMPLTPHEYDRRRRPLNSLFLLGEDDDREFKLRLRKAEADLGRVQHIGRSASGVLPRLPGDWKDIEAVLLGHRARFFVIDPLAHFVTSIGNESAVRAALEPVLAWARGHGGTCCISRHVPKAGGRTAAARAAGHYILEATARVHLLVGKHPEDPEGRRVLFQAPSNCPPHLPIVCRLMKLGKHGQFLVWEEGVYPCTEQQLLRAGQEPSKLDHTCQLLLRAATPTRRVYRDAARRLAHENHISWRTMQEAKALLNMTSGHEGQSGPGAVWFWKLPR